MTAARRDWITTFADPAVLSDLFAAARSCMAQVCDHEPTDCDCELNRATFQEFAEWVELEVQAAQREPTRIEPAGRPNRKRDGDIRMSLTIAG
jgi:hypothetical protein